MIDTSEFRIGLNIKIDEEVYTIIWFQHHKPGKGGAVMRTKLKNLRTGAIIERTFKSGETFQDVELTQRKNQYLYSDNKNCYFMDLETYEQLHYSKETIGKAANFLKEGLEVTALYLEGNFLSIELPTTVELKVIHTVPGIRGDTVSNVTKPATLETGVEIQVPLFINIGDSIRVDTRTGEYVERV